jgi:hypothetical protein
LREIPHPGAIRGDETTLSAQAGQTLTIAPNSLPEVFADLGLLPQVRLRGLQSILAIYLSK